MAVAFEIPQTDNDTEMDTLTSSASIYTFQDLLRKQEGECITSLTINNVAYGTATCQFLSKIDLIESYGKLGLGATLNVAKPKKGSSVAIFGLGVVGLAVQELQGLQGSLVLILMLTDLSLGWGVAVLVGVPHKNAIFKTSPLNLLNERTLKGTFFGNYKPRSDIPSVVEKYMNKELELEKFITHEVPFSEINKAFHLMLKGEGLRCLGARTLPHISQGIPWLLGYLLPLNGDLKNQFLKTLRHQLAANMGSRDEAQHGMLEKDHNRGTYEGMLTLRKELEVLKNEVTKAEAATAVVGKKYDEISKRERELQAQFRTADYMSVKWVMAATLYFDMKKCYIISSPKISVSSLSLFNPTQWLLHRGPLLPSSFVHGEEYKNV
ncbi:hypothetical protein L2E82_02005 [Cichorium intybus]|uniref:Uncharacterized protein n=1 Tax=Cichorium intybus TaxID=13427 RepID=A0ACB9H215_CICIN|nr:hypothetical protein L2E82_02005 [Cichorium intybus]